jgi:hypothetical protein
MYNLRLNEQSEGCRRGKHTSLREIQRWSSHGTSYCALRISTLFETTNVKCCYLFRLVTLFYAATIMKPEVVIRKCK